MTREERLENEIPLPEQIKTDFDTPFADMNWVEKTVFIVVDLSIILAIFIMAQYMKPT